MNSSEFASSQNTANRNIYENPEQNRDDEIYYEKPAVLKKIIVPIILIVLAIALVIWAITRIVKDEEGEPTVEMLDLEKEELVVPTPIATPTPTPTPTTVSDNVSPAVTNPTPVATPVPTPNTVVNQPVISTPTETTERVATAGRLTGRVDLLGNVPNNSSILVLYRLPGESEFKVITRLDARNGATWTWNGAQSGRTYEVKLAFQVDGNNKNVSNTVSAVAPANINITLYTGDGSRTYNDSAVNAPKLESCGERDGDKWKAKIVLPKVENAKQYWLNVGTSMNSNNTLDKQYVGSDQQTIYVDIEDGKEYFAKYAVRNCSDCGDSYGVFGPTLKFKCTGRNYDDNNNDNKDRYYGDFKGFKCVKDIRRCESTNDDNPPYSNTKDGLEKCLNEC